MTATEQFKEEIYREYHGKVLSYLRSRILNRETSEDLASDVFLKVYEKLDSFDDTKASISTWIYTITRNTLTDYFRTRKVFSEIPETVADESSEIEESLCEEETMDQLASALEKLDERERDILILRFYSGKTLKEIAEGMGISYAYVKVLQNKALASMKKLMGDM